MHARLRSLLLLDRLESREVPSAANYNPIAASHANGNALDHANSHSALVSGVQVTTISGFVQMDFGALPAGFTTTLTLTINGTPQPVPVNADGSFQVSVSITQANTSFTLKATTTDGGYVAAPISGTLNPGDQLTNQDLEFFGVG